MSEHPNHEGKSLNIIFIVNGEDVKITMGRGEPLLEGMRRALVESKNDSRPIEEWELRDERGTLLDPTRTAVDYGFEDGTRLFLSLRVGAGERSDQPAMMVDPRVSRAKFNRELEKVRSHASLFQSRGCFLVGEPSFPTVDFVFVPRNNLHLAFTLPPGMKVPDAPPGGTVLGQAEVPNLAARAFKVRVDFSDFDIRAPSVVFLDPWTDQLIPYATLFRATNFEAQRGAHVVLLDDHPTTHRPFLCVRGVREYHEHPQHTGDDWMLYRANSGLFTLLTTIWRTCVDIVRPNLIVQPPNILVNWEAQVKT